MDVESIDPRRVGLAGERRNRRQGFANKEPRACRSGGDGEKGERNKSEHLSLHPLLDLAPWQFDGQLALAHIHPHVTDVLKATLRSSYCPTGGRRQAHGEA